MPSEYPEDALKVVETSPARASRSEFSAGWFPGRIAFLCRIMRSRSFGIPKSLDNDALTEGERVGLQSLQVRNSWVWDAYLVSMERLRSYLVVTGSLLTSGALTSAVYVHQWSTAGMLPIGVDGLVVGGMFWWWHAISGRWGHTTDDWDIRLKDGLARLEDIFVADVSGLSEDLVEIQAALENECWLDDAVWRQLGPLDSLGMMRLTDALDSVPETAVSLNFDGSTHELVSRVAEVARECMQAEREVTISAMKGIEEEPHLTGFE